MNLVQSEIDNITKNSIILPYLDKVLANSTLNEVIPELVMNIDLYEANSEDSILEVIEKKHIEYIILSTKLTTMVEMFNLMDFDNNLVLADKLEQEIIKFRKVISESIIRTNKELIDRQYEN
jgi:hypothetical protein